MIAALALVEGGAIFGVLCAALIGWHHEAGEEWRAVLLALGLAAATLVALYYAGAYDARAVTGDGPLARLLFRGMLFAGLPLAVVSVFAPEFAPTLAAALTLAIAGLAVLRVPFCGLLRSGALAESVLLIGTGPLARRAMDAVAREGHCRCVIVGVVDDEMDSGESFVPPDERLGPLNRLDQIIETTRPHRIVVALQERRRRMPVRPLLDAQLRGIAIEDGAAFYERLTGKMAIEALTPSNLIFSRDFRARRAAIVLGRATSVTVALAGLVLLAPMLVLIAVAVRLDSRGPVFFIQERVGRGGRRFLLVKFRTMHVTDAPPSEWARDNADRITRVGSWLRRYRLDELPQFYNVLRGDMDLVGPRPHPVTNFSVFVTVLRNSPDCGEQIPYYSLRSMVRPGITGWAQVQYRYANNLEEEIEKMRYDLYYVKHRSLWLDLRILADTVKTVLAGRESMDPIPSPAAPADSRERWQLAARPR
jgi:exopolysaccharide biosynthesis polyprenyl glycosylphosphotransferase